MQRGYSYSLLAPIGRDFDTEFRPELCPKQMLRLGVSGGKYMSDTREDVGHTFFDRGRVPSAGGAGGPAEGALQARG